MLEQQQTEMRPSTDQVANNAGGDVDDAHCIFVGQAAESSMTSKPDINSGDSSAARSTQNGPTAGQEAAGESKYGGGCRKTSHSQQRQMFSLKQLAINSRNLTKRRSLANEGLQASAPLVVVEGKSSAAGSRKSTKSTLSRLFEQSNSSSNSSSNCSADNSCASEADTQITGSAAGNTSSAATAQKADDSDPDELAESDSGEGVSDNEGVDGEGELDSKEEDEEEEEVDEDEDDIDSDASSGASAVERRRQRKMKRRQKSRRQSQKDRRLPLGRRSSCCNCEPVVSKIDHDGQPVTDVDLVTYKDLCQMEQHAHQMRTNHRRRNNLESPAAGGQGTVHGSFGAYTGACFRRSSLQEESGAYYQLCTSSEEQAIRRKYAWFPPALKQLHLVDQFFAKFPREKIPYAQPAIATQGSSSGSGEPNDQSTNAPTTTTSATTTSDTSGQTKDQSTSKPVAAPLAGSYRDEQISFQLPRQDISLDYCSYPMSDSSRTNFSQFIERRNSQALDVATVIQIRLNSPPATQATTTVGQKEAAASPQREISQTIAGEQVTSSAPQRCRRCLVRFEDKQLAVLAPNFIIGSTLYRPSSMISCGAGSEPHHRRASAAQLDSPLVAMVSSGGKTTAPISQPTPLSTGHVPPVNVALFHPNCFTCSTCKEFLVDLVYCLRDCKLYCLRHYGESLRPRCSWCQEVSRVDHPLDVIASRWRTDELELESEKEKKKRARVGFNQIQGSGRRGLGATVPCQCIDFDSAHFRRRNSSFLRRDRPASYLCA